MYQSFLEIKRDVEQCERCALSQTRTHAVFGEGNVRADILFVGEGPGAVEDKTGRPFVGPAGMLLEKMLGAVGLSRKDVYIANVVKCRPPGNTDPRPEYAQACIGYLREQVRFIRPKIIVCLGRIAAGYILGRPVSITKERGHVHQIKNFYILPTYHPSALLRNERLKKEAWADFKKIVALRDKLLEEHHGQA